APVSATVRRPGGVPRRLGRGPRPRRRPGDRFGVQRHPGPRLRLPRGDRHRKPGGRCGPGRVAGRPPRRHVRGRRRVHRLPQHRPHAGGAERRGAAAADVRRRGRGPPAARLDLLRRHQHAGRRRDRDLHRRPRAGRVRVGRLHLRPRAGARRGRGVRGGVPLRPARGRRGGGRRGDAGGRRRTDRDRRAGDDGRPALPRLAGAGAGRAAALENRQHRPAPRPPRRHVPRPQRDHGRTDQRGIHLADERHPAGRRAPDGPVHLGRLRRAPVRRDDDLGRVRPGAGDLRGRLLHHRPGHRPAPPGERDGDRLRGRV
ncbi:MAG: hypothetical protein AVDCRST_MAG59-5040, partial [uncultured Thermomicrobiales bacterium]